MAQVTIAKVVESSSSLVLRVDLLSDGTGELKNYVILSPSGLVPPKTNNIPAFRLLQVWYGMVWFDVTIKTGTVTPAVIWTLARDCASHVDFRHFGGLIDPVVYTNPLAVDTGILTFSTNGFLPVGSAGSLVLEIGKTSRASA